MSNSGEYKILTASVNDVTRLAPLFDGYRQFYEQASDIPAVIEYLTVGTKRNIHIYFYIFIFLHFYIFTFLYFYILYFYIFIFLHFYICWLFYDLTSPQGETF